MASVPFFIISCYYVIMKAEKEIIITNFSGIHKTQQFWQNTDNYNIFWLEVQNLSGSNCYCDDEALNYIRDNIKKYTEAGLHYIDSGNYHYMSRLWLEKVDRPFRLIVFDNHTDMQLPAFGGLLSCGGWIANSIEELEFLKEVVLVGPDEEAYSQVEAEFKDKVNFLSRENLSQMSADERENFFKNLDSDLPVYISVDKDVLSPKYSSTTWSQGDMKFDELKKYIEIILDSQDVIGMDICGECDLDSASGNSLNDIANEELLKIWMAR